MRKYLQNVLSISPRITTLAMFSLFDTPKEIEFKMSYFDKLILKTLILILLKYFLVVSITC